MTSGPKTKQAVILAGGFGTRLYPLTQTRAKSLLPVVGVPLIHRIVRYLETNRFDKIIVTLSNFSDQIKENLSELDSAVEIIFSEDIIPLGTAGSVKNASEYIGDETFLVVQGDSLTNIDLSLAEKFHSRENAIATILLQERKEVKGLGVVDIDEECNISNFVEKPSFTDGRPQWISTGLYLLDPRVLDYIPEKDKYDFAKDLFPSLLQMGLKLKGFPAEGYWIDIGTPNAYRQANQWYLERPGKKISRLSGNQLDPISSESSLGGVSFREGLDHWAVVGTSMIHEDSSVDRKAIIENSILERGVNVGSGAVVRDSLILEGSVVEAGATVDSAIVGEGCHLGRGSGVGYGAVIGGYTRIKPNAMVDENSLVPSKSVVESMSTQFVTASR